MSALPPKADIAEHDRHVRFVPKADIRSEFSHWYIGGIDSSARRDAVRGVMTASHRYRGPAQIEPPGQCQAYGVETQIDSERQLRATGCGNGRAEAAGDEVTTAGANGADEAERRGALDASALQRQ